jgi:hypothetical protein
VVFPVASNGNSIYLSLALIDFILSFLPITKYDTFVQLKSIRAVKSKVPVQSKEPNMFTEIANSIFSEVIDKYHAIDDPYQPFSNPYDKEEDLLKHLLYRKCWIDTVQWHYEDIIRDPNIDPEAALVLKRRIDASNQDRTDMVEYIDSYLLEKYNDVSVREGATINTESPAWGVDRLSILALKVYHMREEATREDASEAHRDACNRKLGVLLEQQIDLSTAIEQLLADIEAGRKYMKVYKQMKMYNDDELNPVLRSQK